MACEGALDLAGPDELEVRVVLDQGLEFGELGVGGCFFGGLGNCLLGCLHSNSNYKGSTMGEKRKYLLIN
jgi:hypothetical protein